MQKDKLIRAITDSFSGVENLIRITPEEKLAERPAPGKWSKKEILGHLIDSAVNNIKRFTEIQFMEKPYLVVGYAQDELVTANAYQQKDTQEIFSLWKAVNKQLIHLISIQIPETLNYSIINSPTGENKNLAWLMEDYVDHLLHHLKEILN